MQQRVNKHEETVIKRSETRENARFSNTSFYTHMHRGNPLGPLFSCRSTPQW